MTAPCDPTGLLYSAKVTDVLDADLRLGLLLRRVREAAGLTQEEVARRLGTQKSAISRLENHADDVRLSTLRRYAEAIGASLYLTLTLHRPPSETDHADRQELR
jgi:transcriptional regulator with XRE-family HTH domain